MAPTEDMNLADFDRSNRGASKQRRDQINAEIATMRDLLPLAETARQRLSQLQIMSLTCVYIRKCNVLQKLFRSKSSAAHIPDNLDFFQALTGFLLVTTREGKLLYISENVTDYLGHSMVDMKTQGDSLYDIVDKRDHRAVQAQLMQATMKGETQSIAFFCRMNMSRTLKRQSGFGDVKVMHVRGHFVQANNNDCPGESQRVFMATCSPLITPDLKENLVQNNTMVFKTLHRLDMAFVEVSKTGEHHLEKTSEDLAKTSWYSLLHPEDIHEAKEKHVQLIRSNHEMGCMMTVRMVKPDGTHFWVNIVMHVRQASLSQTDEPMIVCINQVIEAQEAFQIKMQSQMFTMYPGRPQHEMWAPHMTGARDPPPPPHWVHQNGHHLPMPGYQPPMSPIVNHQGRLPPVYPMQCAPNGMPSKPLVGIPAFTAANMAANVAQSDKLKAMLKRKIQGPPQTPCRAVKIPKMSWNMDGSSGARSMLGMDHGCTMMEQYSVMPVPVCGESQGQSVQVIQPVYHRLGVMTAKKSAVMAKIARPELVKSEMITREQVVPNVPDSFLTPDPSPVSSPQPPKVMIKTEMLEPEEENKSSVSILQALEKLASLPQQQKTKIASSLTPERPAERPILVRKRRELPIFDAGDIEAFFANLSGDENKLSVKVEDVQNDCKIKQEMPDKVPCNSHNIPDFLALRNEVCGSPSYTEQYPQGGSPISSTHSQSPQHFLEELCEKKNSPCSKDLVVSSVMASSPTSAGSPERFDDLLGCFSEDGIDLSPLQMDPRSTILESPMSDDLLDDQSEKNDSFYQELSPSVPSSSPERHCPHASGSPLAVEEELVTDASAFTLAMALDALDDQEEVCRSTSIKARDVLSVPDELNLLLGAF